MDFMDNYCYVNRCFKLTITGQLPDNNDITTACGRGASHYKTELRHAL